MGRYWMVDVLIENEKALSIGDNFVSGKVLSLDDEAIIRKAAKSLLAFVGDAPNQVITKVCAICGASPAKYTNGKESLCSTHKRSLAQR